MIDNKTLDFGEIQIKVKFEPDYDADISHYGTFESNPPWKGLYVDRKHGVVTGEQLGECCIQRVYKVPWYVTDKRSRTEIEYDYLNLDRVKEYAMGELEEEGYYGACIGDYDWEYDKDDNLVAVIASGPKAVIDGLDRMGRNEYPYFIVEDNWLAYEKNPTQEQIQEAAQHTALDYNRVMDYENGNWSMYKFTVKVKYLDVILSKVKGYDIESDWDESDINECVGEKIDEAAKIAMEKLQEMRQSFKWIEAGVLTVLERVQL